MAGANTILIELQTNSNSLTTSEAVLILSQLDGMRLHCVLQGLRALLAGQGLLMLAGYSCSMLQCNDLTLS